MCRNRPVVGAPENLDLAAPDDVHRVAGLALSENGFARAEFMHLHVGDQETKFLLRHVAQKIDLAQLVDDFFFEFLLRVAVRPSGLRTSRVWIGNGISIVLRRSAYQRLVTSELRICSCKV